MLEYGSVSHIGLLLIRPSLLKVIRSLIYLCICFFVSLFVSSILLCVVTLEHTATHKVLTAQQVSVSVVSLIIINKTFRTLQ